MTRSLRHGQILKVIRGRSIFTQEELARELKKIGVETTQVTLSRDLRDLRLVKTPEGYRPLSEQSPALHFIQDVRIAQNLVVVKTAAGHAGSVAADLDGEQWPELVGTIAGDDTILVICADAGTAQAVRKRLLQYANKSSRAAAKD